MSGSSVLRSPGLVLICCVAAVAFVGCGAATVEKTRAVIEIRALHGPRRETPASRSNAVGLAHPDNDPVIVDAVREALACAWEPTEDLPPTPCSEPVSAMNRVDFEGKRATLARLLDDEDQRVRMFALRGLQAARDWSTDEALAEKLFTLLESTSDDGRYMATLAETVGCIDLVETGTTHRLEALMRTSSRGVRASLLRYVRLTTNPGHFDTLAAIAQRQDEDENVRLAALTALRDPMPKDMEKKACSVLSKATHDPNERIARVAADVLLEAGFCSTRF